MQVSAKELAAIVAALLVAPESVGELDERDSYFRFMESIAGVVADYCGGEVGSTADADFGQPLIAIHPNDSLPDPVRNVWLSRADAGAEFEDDPSFVAVGITAALIGEISAERRQSMVEALTPWWTALTGATCITLVVEGGRVNQVHSGSQPISVSVWDFDAPQYPDEEIDSDSLCYDSESGRTYALTHLRADAGTPNAMALRVIYEGGLVRSVEGEGAMRVTVRDYDAPQYDDEIKGTAAVQTDARGHDYIEYAVDLSPSRCDLTNADALHDACVRGLDDIRHTRREWREEVQANDTQLGYADWVVHQLEAAGTSYLEPCIEAHWLATPDMAPNDFDIAYVPVRLIEQSHLEAMAFDDALAITNTLRFQFGEPNAMLLWHASDEYKNNLGERIEVVEAESTSGPATPPTAKGPTP